MQSNFRQETTNQGEEEDVSESLPEAQKHVGSCNTRHGTKENHCRGSEDRRARESHRGGAHSEIDRKESPSSGHSQLAGVDGGHARGNLGEVREEGAGRFLASV